MISYAITVAGILVATLVPVYVSLYLFSSLKGSVARYASMFAVGLVFWFFFDTMGDAAQLDVNQAINAFGGYTHVAVISAFLAGIAALGIFDHFAVPRLEDQGDPKPNLGSRNTRGLLFLIPAGVAGVMGIHGLGEGWDFGTAASQAPTQSLTDAFGGIYPLSSYPLHKFLEAAIIGVLYLCFAGTNIELVRRWHLPLLGALFGLPAVIGASIGYFVSLDTTYFFAFGVTAALYATVRLVESTTLGHQEKVAPRFLGARMFLAMTVGFFFLYTAALFH